MRRTALVIGCGDSDLSSRIAYDRLEGMGSKSFLSLDFLRVAISHMAERHGCSRARGRDDEKNGSSSNADIHNDDVGARRLTFDAPCGSHLRLGDK